MIASQKPPLHNLCLLSDFRCGAAMIHNVVEAMGAYTASPSRFDTIPPSEDDSVPPSAVAASVRKFSAA